MIFREDDKIYSIEMEETDTKKEKEILTAMVGLLKALVRREK